MGRWSFQWVELVCWIQVIRHIWEQEFVCLMCISSAPRTRRQTDRNVFRQSGARDHWPLCTVLTVSYDPTEVNGETFYSIAFKKNPSAPPLLDFKSRG